MHPTFGFLAFDPFRACQNLNLSQKRLEEILTDLYCRLIVWNLVELAESFIGVPYELRAELAYPPKTLDCAGLVKTIFACAGIWLPRYTVLQADCGQEIKAANLSTGDLIFFKGKSPWAHPKYPPGVGHVGFMLNPHEYVHTTSQTQRVVKNCLETTKAGVVAYRRIHARPENVAVVQLPKELWYLNSPAELECVIRSQVKTSSRLQ